MEQIRQSGKKGRKVGRKIKKPAQKRYTSDRRWLKNKARKIWKYIKTHPNWKPYNISDETRGYIHLLRQGKKI